MPAASSTFSTWLTKLTRRVNKLDQDVRKARGRAEAERLYKEFNVTSAELQMLKAHADRHEVDLDRYEARLDRVSRTLEAVHEMMRKRTTPWWKRVAMLILSGVRKVAEWGGLLGTIFGWAMKFLPLPFPVKLLSSGND